VSGKVIHLLRHGPPQRIGLLLGHTDEPPCQPCGGLRDIVPDSLPVQKIVSSDLRRARAGAETLAQARGGGLAIDPRWRELDFGEWDGLAPEQIPSDALARFWNDPDACPSPGGERWSALQARVAEALCDLGHGALVVTHGGAMRAAISVVTGLDHRQAWALDLPYGALLSLRIWPGEILAGQIIGLGGGTLR